MLSRRRFFQSSLATAIAYALPAPQLYAVDQAASQAAGGVAAIKLDGSATVIEQAAVAELKGSLRGPLLLAGDAGYDSARRILHPQFDKHPALIVQPTGAADVRNAVTFARERELLVAVKCGGHSFSGKSTCDGGMQIDLSRLRGVRVDPTARRAYVEGGSLLGELDHETMAHGLVTTAGTVSHTGVGGLTLGGGFGRLARRFGLALDNVKSVDIVTADGQLRHASAEENPDLFWAVRGGSGNFGIVTAFEFGLHPMQRQVIGGNLVFPMERARELLEFYAEYSAQAPDELYVDYEINSPSGGKAATVMIQPCYSGPASEAERVLAPLRKLGRPIGDTIRVQDYVAIQRSGDYTDARNNGEYLKAGFITGYTAGLVDAVLNGFRSDPERGTYFFHQQAGGAISRVATDATAFPHRHPTLEIFAVVSWDLARDGKRHVDYVKDYWSKLLPFTDGYYINEVADEHQPKIDENYRGNIGRLRQLKRQYDPHNMFRLNANILPA
ncbi:MAG TPA: FAD-binding oxidoreductase [Steroidobacteraceae bacterium]|nr:FAD-binding oxidoreductase [Steroidobacteraceae bacterium]